MTRNRLSIVLLTLAFAVVPAVGPNTQAAQPQWQGSPVIGCVRVAPLDRLQRDFAFLAESVDGSSTTNVRELFTELSEGIDAGRPGGALLYLDETLVPMIFVPLKDEELLLKSLKSEFGLETRREADGTYRITDADSTLDIVARSVGPWLYATGASNREQLRDVPADPTPLLEGIDPTLTMHVTVNVDQLPAAERAGLIDQLTRAFSEDAAGLGNASAVVRQVVQSFLAETKSVQFELECFRPLRQFHVSSRLTAVEGSALETWIKQASERVGWFSNLPSSDAIFGAVASFKLNSTVVQPLLEAWQPFAAKARGSAPSPQSRDYAQRLFGRVVAQAIHSVTTTLSQGEFDGGLVMERQGRDEIVLLAGTRFVGAGALEKSATEAGRLLQQSPEFRALEWSTGASGDVGIHRFVIPSDDEEIGSLLGSPLRLALGVGTDVIYVALGGDDGVLPLTEAIDRSREDAPERGQIIRIFARTAPFLAALDKVPGEDAESDREWRALVKQIAPFRKNDTLELSLRAQNQALETRFRVDMGIVRMLASHVPGGDASNSSHAAAEQIGSLRLQKGERFQLQFHTDSEVTTTIDQTDRLDHSVYSLTYDFHVLQVDTDGTMHLKTSLNRAKFDKQSPDGRETFDSANPPEPDQATLEMMLHKVVVGRSFILKVRPDGTIAEVSGIEKAIDDILDNELKPGQDERQQAAELVAQLLNEAGLRDSLTRGFEFYPGRQVTVGDRWKRTSENRTAINFLLDNRYQVTAQDGNQVAISVRSQVRETDPVEGAPIVWEVVGSQSGEIALDRRGRLRLAQFTVRLDAEATFEMDGTTVSRPLEGVFKMTIGAPEVVEQHFTGN